MKNLTQIDRDTWVSILGENQIAVPDGVIILTTNDRRMDFEYMGSVRKHYRFNLIRVDPVHDL